MSEIKKWIVTLIFLTALCVMSYMLGRSHSKIKIVKEQGKEIIKKIEVIKYVEKEKAKIWAKSNADSDELINLMQAGKL